MCAYALGQHVIGLMLPSDRPPMRTSPTQRTFNGLDLDGNAPRRQLVDCSPEDDIARSASMAPIAEPANEAEMQSEGTPIPSPDVMLSDGEDATCSDFVNQAAAQTALEADPRDPNGLDLDLDGIACETPFVTPVVPVALPTVSPASQDGRDVNCVDFAFQEDAQVVFDRIPGDPYNLDPSGDGLACSSLPSRDSIARLSLPRAAPARQGPTHRETPHRG